MKFQSVFHPSERAAFKADFDTHDDLILESIMSLITAIIEKQDNFMQGGPVALMQYV